MQAWNVYLNNRVIDTVFWSKNCAPGGASITADMVKQSLVDHDGYDSRIIVRKARN